MSAGKFGFTPDDPIDLEAAEEPLDLARAFQPTPITRVSPPRLAEMDRVAQAAGFTSRENTPAAPPPRRRRVVTAQPTRFLAVRAPESLYQRFVRYADKHQLTYHDAIAQLLDTAGEPE
ncbi:hypothetical protein SAMN05421770_10980 [Granulicella rosea]|uniref:Stability/partitioning determinant n=1 Tax=Granulicella rosea TaxID=474952 RepID=A0A239M339_9BACT|nr:hypothetical protein [Granulicella rosea]SNT37106.1 hypothetical protein SAMN05421770_10980 [Granulicella rosea]